MYCTRRDAVICKSQEPEEAAPGKVFCPQSRRALKLPAGRFVAIKAIPGPLTGTKRRMRNGQAQKVFRFVSLKQIGAIGTWSMYAGSTLEHVCTTQYLPLTGRGERNSNDFFKMKGGSFDAMLAHSGLSGDLAEKKAATWVKVELALHLSTQTFSPAVLTSLITVFRSTHHCGRGARAVSGLLPFYWGALTFFSSHLHSGRSLQVSRHGA